MPSPYGDGWQNATHIKILFFAIILLAELLWGSFVGVRFGRGLLYVWYHHYALRRNCVENNSLRLKNLEKFLLLSERKSQHPVKVVVVVGESATRSAMGCYSGSENTTPFFSSMLGNSGFYLFPRAYSREIFTCKVLPNMFTRLSPRWHRNFFETPSLFDVCNRAGVRIKYISNQYSYIGDWNNYLAGVAKEYPGRSIYDAGIADLRTLPDGCLLDAVVSEFENVPGNMASLTVVHMFGSHFPFEKRVPEKFAEEHYGSNTARECYLNTILYSDIFLKNVFERFVNSVRGPRCIIYVSDHGEDVTGRVKRSEELSSVCKEMLEIPLAIWVSKEFASLYPEKVEALRCNVSKLFINDYLYDSVLDLFDFADCGNVVWDARQSVFSSSYREPERTVECIGGQSRLCDWFR